MDYKGPFIISTGGGLVATTKTPHKNTWLPPPPFAETKKVITPPFGYTKSDDTPPPICHYITTLSNSIIEILVTNGSTVGTYMYTGMLFWDFGLNL